MRMSRAIAAAACGLALEGCSAVNSNLPNLNGPNIDLFDPPSSGTLTIQSNPPAAKKRSHRHDAGPARTQPGHGPTRTGAAAPAAGTTAGPTAAAPVARAGPHHGRASAVPKFKLRHHRCKGQDRQTRRCGCDRPWRRISGLLCISKCLSNRSVTTYLSFYEEMSPGAARIPGKMALPAGARASSRASAVAEW
jgi:hypothetical protein